jgi:alpha-D-ribose 1-methylphosphonate 5-triphosphate synthase subunit PhnG
MLEAYLSSIYTEVKVDRFPVYCCKSTDIKGISCVQGRENHSSTKCMLCDAFPRDWANGPYDGDLLDTERVKSQMSR